MVKKKTVKPSGFPIFGWIVFLLLLVAGWYVWTHQKEVNAFVKKETPVAQKAVEEGVAKTEKAVAGAVEKGKEFYDEKIVAKQPTPGGETRAVAVTPGGELTICTFNIRIFSNKSRTDEDLRYIAGILKKYDLVAIEELRDETVLRRTVAELKVQGFDYAYEASPPVGHGVKERYAFLYRPDKVTVIKHGKIYPDANNEFIRPPYYAYFKSGKFDFILVANHILFGNSLSTRRLELKALSKAYSYIQNEDPKEKDVIVVGDFNCPPTDEGWSDIKEYPTMVYLIKPPAKTTITDTSLYDNFWFQTQYVTEYTGKEGIDKFDETIFDNDDKKASKVVSDHRPVWAVFDTAK